MIEARVQVNGNSKIPFNTMTLLKGLYMVRLAGEKEQVTDVFIKR